MFELIEMTEEMKKKLDSDTRLCVINKMSNIIIWSEAAHWTEIEMGFYYERFYIAKDYTKIAFFILSYDVTYLPNGSEHFKAGDKAIYNWSIISFERLHACAYQDDELLEMLKDGLSVYGGGVYNKSHPDFAVTFNF